MQILLYSRKQDKNESRLAEAIRIATPGKEIELLTSLADLRERLRSIIEPASIAILVAADREELQNLQAFRDMLTEIYVILVIPDWQESTVKLAYILKPRFMNVLGDDFLDLSQIIAKIVQNPHPSPPAGKNPSHDPGPPS